MLPVNEQRPVSAVPHIKARRVWGEPGGKLLEHGFLQQVVFPGREHKRPAVYPDRYLVEAALRAVLVFKGLVGRDKAFKVFLPALRSV